LAFSSTPQKLWMNLCQTTRRHNSDDTLCCKNLESDICISSVLSSLPWLCNSLSSTLITYWWILSVAILN
jgi:hypothetical protein